MNKIFISYTAEDKEYVEKLAKLLAQRSNNEVQCWFYQHNHDGSPLGKIEEPLDACPCLIFIMSKNVDNHGELSTYIQNELNRVVESNQSARKNGKKERPIIPIRVKMPHDWRPKGSGIYIQSYPIIDDDEGSLSIIEDILRVVRAQTGSDTVSPQSNQNSDNIPKLGKAKPVVELTTLSNSEDIMHFNHALQFDRLLRPRRALEELRKISKQDDLIVRYCTLRIRYALEGGVDEIELEDAFVKACNLGCADAKANLASKYLDDWDSKGSANASVNQCMEWLKEAIIAGEPEALVELADAYGEGKYGVSKDKALAEKLFRQAIDAGSLMGRINLGLHYWGQFSDNNNDVKSRIDAEDVLRPILLEHLQKNEADADKTVHWIIALAYFSGIVVQQDYSLAMYFSQKVLSSRGKSFSQEDIILSFAWSILGGIYLDPNGRFKNEQEAFKCFANACKIGTRGGVAEYQLALCYENGIGVDKDEKIAMEWYKRAANKGSASALLSLAVKNIENGKIDVGRVQLSQSVEKGDDEARVLMGLFLCEGQFFPIDVPRGLEYINLSAKNGNADAMKQLGLISLGGLYGVEKDVKKAEGWLIRAAESGNASAECSLGTRYGEGDFGVVDNQKAVYWWNRAAEHGNVDAMCNMGQAYLSGIGVMANPHIAFDWFKKAAEAGSVKAMLSLGAICLDDKWGMVDKEQAEKWFLRAVETGDADALNAYAVQLYDGAFGDADKAKALEMWTRAADKKCAAAMVSLGECYRDGDGVPADPQKAVQWFERAIELKNTRAMIHLAEMYLKGEVVVHDKNKALQLFTKAFDAGDEQAALILAKHYGDGDFGEKDYKKAVEWYNRASEHGSAIAKLVLGVIYCRREFSDGVIDQDIEQARDMFLKAYENDIVDAAFFIGLDCLFSLGRESMSYRKWQKVFRKKCNKMDNEQVLSRAYGQFKLPLNEDSSQLHFQGACLFWLARIERFRGNRQSAIELYSKANDNGYERAAMEMREYKSPMRRLIRFFMEMWT